ncbi:hypothetical protein BD626DRAFT_486551 [Schizophyllum amplum]|uniref:Uncharacterized protein n=1 Tax=Schizophyllum amplum TaxID=97359 RepID=A0A550CMM7_9AGAR|nr:hypothetical protein BD626DRAFT_486551 [Auriculariopsis ampla]
MSSATLTGVALLQNARKADCSSTIVDARFRLSLFPTALGGPRELIAALSLAHADDKSPELEGVYVVRAEVRTANIPTDLSFLPTPDVNYHLVGELTQVMPFHRCGFMTHDDARLRLFTRGAPSNVDTDDLAFSLLPYHHSAVPLPPIHAFTPRSGRPRQAASLRPLLKDACFVDVEGFIAAIYEDENFGNLTRIDLELVRTTRSSGLPCTEGRACCTPLRPAESVMAGRKRKLA